MRGLKLHIAACITALIVPFIPLGPSVRTVQGIFPGWPDHFEGCPLTPLPLSETEARFAGGFPGHIGKFSAGERTIILRWVQRETRKLHAASDCFKGSGYDVRNMGLTRDSRGVLWGSFLAVKGKEVLKVRERAYDSAGNGWTGVSEWYWAAFLGRTEGPWWAVTVVERGE